MAKQKFDIKQLMSETSVAQSKDAQAERKTAIIPLDMLDASPENLYSMDGIEELAASIEIVGLLQPPLVRRKPDGRYAIIAGHRRRAALQMLVDGGNEEYKSIPCVLVKHDDDVIAELQLLMANSTARVMTDADKVYQAERIKELLTRLKDSGYKFGMRMRDVIAQLMQTSYTNAGRYESIIKNLSEEWRKLFSAGRISITTAYELSRRGAAEQAAILDGFNATGVVRFPARDGETVGGAEQEQEQPRRGKTTDEIIAEAEEIRAKKIREAKEQEAAADAWQEEAGKTGIQSAARSEVQRTEEEQATAFSIAQADIDNEITMGRSFAEGKLRIYKFYQTIHTQQEAIAFLKGEYGIGGHSYTYLDGSSGFVDHDSKGLRFQNYNMKGEQTFSWQAVNNRLQDLIMLDRYLSEKEKAYLPEWEQKQAEREITRQEEAGKTGIIGDALPDGIQSAARIEAQRAEIPLIIHVVKATYEMLEDGKTIYFEQYGSDKRMAVRLEVVS